MKQCMILSFFTLSVISNKMVSAFNMFLPDPTVVTDSVREMLGKRCKHPYPFLTKSMYDITKLLRDQERVTGPIRMDYQEHELQFALSGGDFTSLTSAGAKVKELYMVISALSTKLCRFDGVGCSASKSNIGCVFHRSQEIRWAEYFLLCQELKSRGKKIKCVEVPADKQHYINGNTQDTQAQRSR